MGVRTADQFLESLRDGRRVYYDGELVEDVTQHPTLGISAQTAAINFALANSEDPQLRDLFVTRHPETGEPMSRQFQIPKEPEDLEKRLQMIGTSIRLTDAIPFGKAIGTDALYAVMTAADEMGKTELAQRARSYLEFLRTNDLNLCGAITDVKGDRAKTPSEQVHPDYYVRVVDKNDKGIVVKGAKMHITGAPACNEILVLPTRQMRSNEADYAVAFAVPANAPGVSLICRPSRGPRSASEFPIAKPIRSLTEAMIIFDDVFVPWERVFLHGEPKFATRATYNFGTYHRFTGVAYKIPHVEVLAGMAVAMAEVNGVEKAGHIRDKLVDIVIYVETLKALATAAISTPVMFGGIAVPNPLITNMAKLHFASRYHEMVRIVQDIAGGIITTAPTYKDWLNPATHDYLDYYLGASPKYTTEERLRMIALTHDEVGSAGAAHAEVTTLHGEGPMAAQRMMILADAPTKKYRDEALHLAGVEPKD